MLISFRIDGSQQVEAAAELGDNNSTIRKLEKPWCPFFGPSLWRIFDEQRNEDALWICSSPV